MEHKIKTIREFIKDGPPQFDVILRRDKGEPVQFSVSSESKEIDLEYIEMIYPEPTSDGLIKIVKRISDDAVFHTNDMVEVKGVGSCFIIKFEEDLINCYVLDAFGDINTDTKSYNKVLVQVNNIKSNEEDYPIKFQGIEGDGEDHEDIWPSEEDIIGEW